jgi:signal transduction histidine kinase
MSLWYLATTVVLLLVFSLVTFFGARHLAFRALDREHDVIAASIEGRFDPNTNTFQDLNNTPYHVNWHLEESYMVVYDAQERPVFQSPMTKRMSLPIQLVRTARESKSIIDHPVDKAHAFRTSGDDDIPLLAVSRKLYVNERAVGWLVIATPIGDIQQAARRLLTSLIIGAFLVGALAGVWSFHLTKRNLRPVANITRAARRIGSTNLAERITVEDQTDEVGQLAAVLNGLLGRLQEAFESQRRFIADGAHEIKTPLAVLRTHWEDELNNPDLPMDMKEKLVGDIESISRLTRVINTLLLLSQTEFADAGFDMTSVQLDGLLQEIVSETEVLAGMKSQELSLADSQPVVVPGDRDRLYQLFFNLFDNAVKYTPVGGTITVSLAVEDGEAVVRIDDSGVGIPDADLQYVFDRFYRVSKDRSPETGGSGLGLSICKMIAESHKGSITVTSQCGVGSTFAVHLPLQQ